MKKFSIIIPIYNSLFIEKQLQTLSSQTYLKDKFEVVYIDDGSDESFQKQYQEIFLQFPEISIIYDFFGEKNGRFRVQEARNRGVERSNYENLVFIDADCLFPEYYLKNLNILLEKNEYQVIMGHSIGYNHREDVPSIVPEDIIEKKYEKYLSNEIYNDFRNPLGVDRLWKVCIGGNLFVKKDILLSIGGWDNSIASWGGGDIDVGFRLYRAGYDIQYITGIEVYNIKDEARINARKFLSFMKNQIYLIQKYNFDTEYFDYVKFRYQYTPVKYKIGIMPQEFREIFFPQKKILLFCSSSSGMGHFMRTLKLYHSLSRKYQVKIIIEGKIAEAFLEGVDYIYIQKGEFSSGDKEKIQERYFLDFLPDYFLADFFPFGKFALKGDIDFCIQLTKENKGKVFTYMRDIYDGTPIPSDKESKKYQEKVHIDFKNQDFQNIYRYAHETGQSKYLAKLFIEQYISKEHIDAICVFGDSNLYQISQEYNFSPQVSLKIHYLGYLLEGELELSSDNQDAPKNILVSSGGNFFNKKNYLRLLSTLSFLSEYHIDFFPGNISNQEMQNLRNTLIKYSNITIHDFSQAYYDIYKKSKVVFFCGGYNSFCDIIQYQKKAAFMNYDEGDSKYRVDVAETYTRGNILSKYLDITDFSEFDTFKILNFIKNISQKHENIASFSKINIFGYDGILDFIDKYEQKDEV